MPQHFPTRTEGIVVPPKSKKKIAAVATALRKFFGMERTFRFPIEDIYEYLHLLYDGANFEVIEEIDMGSDHGRTYPDKNLILLRNDVYEGACNGVARDRFTMCHELGHLILHRGIALSRIDPRAPPEIYRNSEWQADIFASNLLMPQELVSECESVLELPGKFGVSLEAALIRGGEIQRR